MTPADRAWTAALPKAELHVHMEGCIPPETVGLGPADAGFSDLAGFLAFLDRCCTRVTTGEQLQAAAAAIASRAAESGVGQVDVIVNPTHWPAWRHRLDELIAHLDAGMAAGEEACGVTSTLCLSLTRTQPQTESAELVDWLLARRPARIAALSIDGNEAAAGRTGRQFSPFFEIARRAGLRTCAHAGESSGPEGVRDAIHLLGAERIDHGIRSVEDPTLVSELAERRIALDVCPTSNVRLGVATSLAAHPIEPLRAAGVAVTVNTDDPLLFATSVAGEIMACVEEFGWTRTDVAGMARTSITSSFATPERRTELLAALDHFLAE